VGNDLRNKWRWQIRRCGASYGRGGSVPLLANKLGNRRWQLFEQFPGESDKALILTVIEHKVAASIGGFRECRNKRGKRRFKPAGPFVQSP
jgi:hypothetical protein